MEFRYRSRFYMSKWLGQRIGFGLSEDLDKIRCINANVKYRVNECGRVYKANYNRIKGNKIAVLMITLANWC